jgi:hypothetical protein
MNRKAQRLVETLLDRDEYVIIAALQHHRAYMLAQAEKAQDAPSASPGMISLAPTTSGLRHMAGAFTESAGRSARVLAALEEISEAMEEEK